MQVVSTQLSQMVTHSSSGSRAEAQPRRGKAKWKASMHHLHACKLSQGGLQTRNYKCLLCVFLKVCSHETK